MKILEYLKQSFLYIMDKPEKNIKDSLNNFDKAIKKINDKIKK